MSEIVQGYRDPNSGHACGWANGTMTCSVPGCKFSDYRCVLVQRERGIWPENPEWEQADAIQTANSQSRGVSRERAVSVCS